MAQHLHLRRRQQNNSKRSILLELVLMNRLSHFAKGVSSLYFSRTGGIRSKHVPRRNDYVAFDVQNTRWKDNDVYGHVNNIVYYSWFDTAVNRYLIQHKALDIHAGETVGLVIETSCTYFSSISYPDLIHIGMKVSHLGTSSVKYEVGVFKNDDDLASARGHFIHVYVNRATNRPTPIPPHVRQVIKSLLPVNE